MIINSMAIKLEVFKMGGVDVLSRITQGVDLYNSAKFRAFNTNLNNVACLLHHFPVLSVSKKQSRKLDLDTLLKDHDANIM